jgi:signal transduction histidine kinase
MSEQPSPSTDYSLRILWSLARWIEDKKGRDELARIAAEAGVTAADFDGSTHWVSHSQFESVLENARALAESDNAFVAACTYRIAESYGALRYMVWALSPQQVCDSAAKLSTMVTKAGTFEVLSSKSAAFDVRYRTTLPESRLMCLSRQAQWAAGPTMWGLPAAQLEEKGCVAYGDPYCEYHLKWFERSRRLPVLAGLAAGVALAVAVRGGTSVGWIATVALPILGALLGYVLELRRTGLLNLKLGQDVNRVLRDLGETEAETRSEIVALHQRQREWIRLMEHQVTERTTTLERIVEGLDGLQQTRVSTIRGFSHDLRNPLFVVRGNTQFLRERFKDGDEGEALRDMEAAALQIEAMLSKLMEVASAETGFVKLAPKPVAVAPLADTFRRRLKALVHGRDIKVSVFCTREAPESILVDPLVFDRVVDNLLTNAAKYTDRGSILLEISGTPGSGGAKGAVAANDDGPGDEGFLTLKLSDTGQGIPSQLVERIFRPRPAHEPSQRPDSYGIGLSSVVRLLAQIGGRLDVMSKADVGTTFWAHFPALPPEPKKGVASDDNLESMITRVVTIRKVEGT